jgi:hypothetical protein
LPLGISIGAEARTVAAPTIDQDQGDQSGEGRQQASVKEA